MRCLLPIAEIFGNASSLHQPALEEARERVAGLIGAEAEEVYFTSGGTESENMAIRGADLANRDRGKQIITTTIDLKPRRSTDPWGLPWGGRRLKRRSFPSEERSLRLHRAYGRCRTIGDLKGRS
ncbi:aminotransferase class V-fold PLP-dependent enzyme [Candidatus Methanocrinis natronophilus]|uniref:Aminotransferase class V-fold PLP-dependent enzyme n=1 Tax=Candidatus Methanocrinis natronophilus TaxID=3033396 RepID=A0ABT5X8K3_9EURY|nr:aminotransferase class V-fold PLP-dependent enzyme [Candidatus Methanocrinis natronophilus]MDF0591029.1 aminotransferase class V-fold PLP-dependent enzyme [Candidatus Methanocrinis natronophilus]